MNGFTRSLDRKIEASKRRQAEEQRAKTPTRAPTQGLTDPVSTPNCNVPARSVPLGGYAIEGAAHFGPGAKLEGHVFERVVFDPPITVQKGDTIEMHGGTIRVTPGRAALPVDQICTVAEAMDRLKLAMKEDPDYARTWHDNIAMAFKDEGYAILSDSADWISKVANEAAARLMRQAFDIKTGSGWQNMRPAKNTGIAGSLDAQLAAAKAESPASIIETLTAEGRDRYQSAARPFGAPKVFPARLHDNFADAMERLRSIPPEAPGGMNEVKVRMFDAMGNAPQRADLSDAKGCITQRLMTSAEVEALLARDINSGCGVITVDAKAK